MTLFLNDNVAAHSAETVKNAIQMFQERWKFKNSLFSSP
jgi:hypothetical protein